MRLLPSNLRDANPAIPLASLVLALALLLPAAAADAAGSPTAIELANANTVALLAAAREARDKLDNPPPGDDPGQAKIYFDTAVDCFNALYQLHGCEWAVPELRGLYARPDAPPLRLGFSPDGRVLLRVEPLDLLSPVYADYTVLLCSFGSQTSREYREAAQGDLQVTLPDGTPLALEQLDPAHPLWPSLERMALQYAAPGELPSGAGVAWKQLYAVPRSALDLNACGLSLDWGGYRFDLPRWTGAEPGADSDG